jgi:hypothetical protein
MTAIDSTNSDANHGIAMFYLIAPATGAHNVVVTVANQGGIYASSASYTGASQFVQPDAHNLINGQSLTLSVVASNCWIVATSGAGPTISGVSAGSGFTIRQTPNNSGNWNALEDSNGTVSTGNNTVAFSATGGNINSVIAVSIVPAVSIALDSTSSAGNTGINSLSWPHTCSGTNRILFVALNLNNTAVGITSVTYNGVSMTNIDNITSGSSIRTLLYYLINPTSGTNTVAMTTNNGNIVIEGVAASYTGASQFSQPDASAQAGNTNTVNISVVNSNCWIIGACGDTAGGGVTYIAGSGFTLRQQPRFGGIGLGLQDSNGIVTSGSNTVAMTTSAGGPITVVSASINSASSVLYWVGGTGNWDNASTTHWSTTSGGSGSQGVPDTTTTCVFDGNSGGGNVTVSTTVSVYSVNTTGYTGTITQSSSLTIGNSMTIGSATTFSVGAALTVTGDLTMGASTVFSGSSALSLGGSLTLTSGMTLSYTGNITLTSTAIGKTITTAGKTVGSTLTFNGVGGTWTLKDNLTSSTSITITNGTVDFNGKNVTATSLSNAGTLTTGNGTLSFTTVSSTGTLTLGSGILSLSGTGSVWNNTGTFTCGTSTIKLTDTSSSSKTFSGGNQTYYNLYITGSGTGAYTIVGNNTFNDFKCDTPPHTINFTAGSKQTLNTFTVNGTAGNLMTLQSTVAGSNWYLYKNTSGQVSCDYLSLQDSHVEII